MWVLVKIISPQDECIWLNTFCLPQFDHIPPIPMSGNSRALQSQVSQVRWRRGQWAYRSKNGIMYRLELRKTEKVAQRVRNSKMLLLVNWSSWNVKTCRPGSAVLPPGGFGLGLGVGNLESPDCPDWLIQDTSPVHPVHMAFFGSASAVSRGYPI